MRVTEWVLAATVLLLAAAMLLGVGWVLAAAVAAERAGTPPAWDTVYEEPW